MEDLDEMKQQIVDLIQHISYPEGHLIFSHLGEHHLLYRITKQSLHYVYIPIPTWSNRGVYQLSVNPEEKVKNQ